MTHALEPLAGGPSGFTTAFGAPAGAPLVNAFAGADEVRPRLVRLEEEEEEEEVEEEGPRASPERRALRWSWRAHGPSRSLVAATSARLCVRASTDGERPSPRPTARSTTDLVRARNESASGAAADGASEERIDSGESSPTRGSMLCVLRSG